MARRLSAPAVKLLALMLEDPAADHDGLDLCRRAELLSGTVYPLLRRLEGVGVLESRFEDVDPSQVGRPARRLYRLVGNGERARAELLRAERPGLREHLA